MTKYIEELRRKRSTFEDVVLSLFEQQPESVETEEEEDIIGF